MLGLAGAIVPIVADGGPAEAARIIRGDEGRHPLAVHDNQPTLTAAVEAVFDRAGEVDLVGVRCDGHAPVKDGRGRPEARCVAVVSDPEGRPGAWPDVAAAVRVNREREAGGQRAVASGCTLDSGDSPPVLG